jgi:hypothetical protein
VYRRQSPLQFRYGNSFSEAQRSWRSAAFIIPRRASIALGLVPFCRGELLIPMVATMRQELISRTYIQADETPMDGKCTRPEGAITKLICGRTVDLEEVRCSTSA